MGREVNKNMKDEEIENKRVYLQLLQEPISRMSTTSAIFKGFSATILAGLASASFTDINTWALFLGLLPLLSFFCMDIYYLSLERKLKYRYRMVVENKTKIDFSINTKLKKDEKKEAKASIIKCLISPSIWLFYVPIIGCAITLFILKFNGVF